MNVILVGWMYVVLMWAIVQEDWVKGLVWFILVGVIPFWASLLMIRLRRKRLREAKALDDEQKAARAKLLAEGSTNDFVAKSDLNEPKS